VATIYDVAKAAGVSPKTVSRVLNADAPVGEKTRDAVNAAMRELGYVPSSAARMMRSNKSSLIGLITGAISQGLNNDEPVGLPSLFIVQGIQKALGKSGKTLMIADTGGEPARVPELVKTFVEHRVEGLIYVAAYHQQIELPGIPEELPFVLSNCFDGRGRPAILPDDRTGQRDLVSRLIQSGHRRIGFLTLDRTMIAAQLRYQGYRDALAAHGIAYDDALVTMAYEQGREKESVPLMGSLERLLSTTEPPTVICCGNDEMAMRVYGLLRSRGVRVPEGMSVAGYDNYQAIAETLFPPLTTVELPYVEMGMRTAQTLMSIIEDKSSAPTAPLIVSGPVFWRSSVLALNSVSILETKGRNNK
jgi:LacI family transcriptional regulator